MTGQTLIKTDALGDTLWTRIYADSSTFSVCEHFIQTPDSGYFLVGRLGTPPQKIIVVRTDMNGDTLWTRILGDGYSSEAYGCLRTTNGDLIVAGTKNDSAGNFAALLVRFSSNGTLISAKRYLSNLALSFHSCVEAANGDLVFAGNEGSNNIIVRTDSNGNVIWSTSYPNTGSSLISIQKSFGGNFIILSTTITYGSGSYDLLLVKVSSSGTIMWSKTYGGIYAEPFAGNVKQTSDFGYILSGASTSFNSQFDWDAYLVKLDSLGTIQWSKTYGSLNAYEKAYDVVQTADGGYAFVGDGNASSLLIKTNSSGSTGLCNEANVSTLTTSPVLTQNTPNITTYVGLQQQRTRMGVFHFTSIGDVCTLAPGRADGDDAGPARGRPLPRRADRRAVGLRGGDLPPLRVRPRLVRRRNRARERLRRPAAGPRARRDHSSDHARRRENARSARLRPGAGDDPGHVRADEGLVGAAEPGRPPGPAPGRRRQERVAGRARRRACRLRALPLPHEVRGGRRRGLRGGD